MKKGSNIVSVFMWEALSSLLYTSAPPHFPLLFLGTWRRKLPMKDREEEGIQIDIYTSVYKFSSLSNKYSFFIIL